MPSKSSTPAAEANVRSPAESVLRRRADGEAGAATNGASDAARARAPTAAENTADHGSAAGARDRASTPPPGDGEPQISPDRAGVHAKAASLVEREARRTLDAAGVAEYCDVFEELELLDVVAMTTSCGGGFARAGRNGVWSTDRG